MERESALRLPRAWGGVAASAVRDAVHKAGDSLRPAAHALRDAVPKIRDSLHPAASAIRGVMPKIIHDSLRASSDGGSSLPPRALLAAFATGGLFVGIGLAVPVGLLMRHGPSHPPADGASPAGSVASTGAPAALAKPHESEAALATCKVAGPPRTLADDATVAAGVEVRTFGSDIALGYAASDTEAKVIRLDPSSLSIVATTTGASKIAIKRVTPVPIAGGGLGVAIDVDRRNDVVRGRRTISVEPLQQVGVSAGNLVWVQRFGGPGTGKLWPVEKHGEIDSIRSAAGEAGGEKLLALAFRRKSSVAVGLMRAGDTPAPQGELHYFNGLGSSVGSPVVALNGGVVFAAWADRPGPEAAWGIRSVRFDIGGSSGEPRMFTPPPGGKGGPAIAPSIASLPQKGFLLVWSEGPAAGRGVRAMTVAESGESVGQALDLSNAGANAGQAQAAVDPSGHGVVAFLQSAGGNFELVATPIACGP
jgi:hypothetical protein